jgi:hypothetical protein
LVCVQDGVNAMAYYLVRAIPRKDRLQELETRLERGEFISMRPFGTALSQSLCHARAQPDGSAIWEEEDYCRPPLAEERAAVLDHYFDNLKVEAVEKDSGWKDIEHLPRLFPGLAS